LINEIVLSNNFFFLSYVGDWLL